MGVETGGQNGSPAAPQEQNTIIHTYHYKQSGPFVVIVESNDKNLGNIHPAAFGKKLKNSNVQDLIKIKKKGKNRLSLEFTTTGGANGFLKNDILKNENLRAYIPGSLASCKGIIRGIDVEITMEEFIREAESTIPIIGARRIRKKINNDQGLTNFEDTEDIVVTFKGTSFPSYVRIYFLESNVRLYIPLPTICLNCIRYKAMQE